jgi:hypothetical protein
MPQQCLPFNAQRTNQIPRTMLIMSRPLVRMHIGDCRLLADPVQRVDVESSDEEAEASDVKVEQPKLTEEEEIANKKCV